MAPAEACIRSATDFANSSLESMRLQQTRLHRNLSQVGLRLDEWASNPWRRLSLQLIVLLSAFAFGGAVGMITGALGNLDPLAALICVGLLETAVRLRRPLLEGSQRLRLELLDMSRIGLLYGLLLDGFKIL